eukprot:scaffold22200_cov107-Isochrysis_galbana.AAC.1
MAGCVERSAEHAATEERACRASTTGSGQWWSRGRSPRIWLLRRPPCARSCRRRACRFRRGSRPRVAERTSRR